MSTKANQQRGVGPGMPRAAWVAQQKSRKAVLYVVRLYGHAGEPPFYKLGITYDLRQRLSRFHCPYQWRTIARYSSYNAGKVWDLEQQLHAAFAHLRHAPALAFSGHTECFSDCADLLAALPADTFFLKPISHDH